MKKKICNMVLLTFILTAVFSPVNISAQNKLPQIKSDSPNVMLKHDSSVTSGETSNSTVSAAATSSTAVTGATTVPAGSEVPNSSNVSGASAMPVSGGAVIVDDAGAFETQVETNGTECKITGLAGNENATTIVIPEKIKDTKVTGIADEVFAKCTVLKNLIIKTKTLSIGKNVFAQGVKPHIYAPSSDAIKKYAKENSYDYTALVGPGGVSAQKKANLKTINVSYAEVNDAYDYVIYMKKGSGKFKKQGTTKETAYKKTGLAPGKKYTFKVVSRFKTSDGTMLTGTGTQSKKVSLVPAKVSGLKASGISGGVSVKWKMNKAAAGYQVFMRVHVNGFKTKFNKIKTINKKSICAFNCKMLVRGMTYSYKVRLFVKSGKKKIYGDFATVTTKAK